MSPAVLQKEAITRKPGAFEKRIHEIDFIRGVLIALVMMDHLFCWLWQYNDQWAHAAMAAGRDYGFFLTMFKIFNFYWTSTARGIIRYIALFGFTFVSGVSCAFSRSNWKRAGQMLLIYFVLAIVSNIGDVYFAESWGLVTLSIDFNVIGVLAWSTLIYCFVQEKSWRSLVAGILGFFLIGFYLIPWMERINDAHNWIINAPPIFEPMVHADWLPLFPYVMFFFMGALFSYFFYAPTKQSLIKHRGNWERPICFLGRHSLWFYALHNLVLIPFFMFLSIWLGK